MTMVSACRGDGSGLWEENSTGVGGFERGEHCSLAPKGLISWVDNVSSSRKFS